MLASGKMSSVWRESITRWAPVTFAPPASPHDVAAAEAALGGPLPRSLVDLLRESNGVEGEYGLGLVWPLARLVDDNLRFRSDPVLQDIYMPFDQLLFFADAGNGDQFAFARTPPRDDVFVWNHEDDRRTWAAPDLEHYLQWWLDGTLTI